MAQKIEKDGETIWVSDDIDPTTLDTDALVAEDPIKELLRETKEFSKTELDKTIDTYSALSSPKLYFTFVQKDSQVILTGILQKSKSTTKKSLYTLIADWSQAIQLQLMLLNSYGNANPPLLLTELRYEADVTDSANDAQQNNSYVPNTSKKLTNCCLTRVAIKEFLESPHTDLAVIEIHIEPLATDC